LLKTITKLTVGMTLLGLAMAGPAFAENRAGATTLTPMLGYQVFDGDLDIDGAAAFGFALGYNFTPNWSIEVDGRFMSTETDGDPAQDLDVFAVSVGGLYHFQPYLALTPYLKAGVGGIIYDPDEAPSNDEDPEIYWGGGIKYSLSDTIALRGDLRHSLDFRVDSGTNDHDEDTIRNNFSAMLGVTFQLGGR